MLIRDYIQNGGDDHHDDITFPRMIIRVSHQTLVLLVKPIITSLRFAQTGCWNELLYSQNVVELIRADIAIKTGWFHLIIKKGNIIDSYQKASEPNVVRKSFPKEISVLIHPSSSEGTKFLNYLEVTAEQLNIRDFDAQEIISEAVMRGLIALSEKDQKIQNPQAWLRQVCTHTLCDRAKEQEKPGF